MIALKEMKEGISFIALELNYTQLYDYLQSC